MQFAVRTTGRYAGHDPIDAVDAARPALDDLDGPEAADRLPASAGAASSGAVEADPDDDVERHRTTS